MKIILKIDKYRRIVINDIGGFDLEAHVDGIGWVLDNDADVSDHVIRSYLEQAKDILSKVNY
jgi:hypothetical protein